MAPPSDALEGDADMYGLGIRLGFYIQWVAGSLAALLQVKSDVVAVRSALFGFTIATFLAIVVQLAQTTSSITTVDIYISLLLCFGFFYFYLFIWPWRAFKYLRSKLNKSNKQRPSAIRPVVVASPEFDILQKSLLLAVGGMKIWFWAMQVENHNNPKQHAARGFLFYPLRLDNIVLIIFNIVIDIFMICGFCYELAFVLRGLLKRRTRPQGDQQPVPPVSVELPFDDALEAAQNGPDKETQNRERDAQNHDLYTMMLLRLIASVIVVLATELTISWNNLQGMKSLGTTGQLIPFVLGLIALTHVLYRRFFPTVEPYASSAEFLIASALGDSHFVMSYLVGADGMNLRTSPFGHLALCAASTEGHLSIVNMLLRKGADPNAVTERGFRPLYQAALHGHYEVVKLLIENGADVKKGSDQDGKTPLHAAALNGNADIVDILIAKGAVATAPDKFGERPMLSAVQGKSEGVIRSLVNAGVDIDQPILGDQTALYLAVLNKEMEIVRLLMELKAKVEIPGLSSPLDVARCFPDRDIEEILTQQKPLGEGNS